MDGNAGVWTSDDLTTEQLDVALAWQRRERARTGTEPDWPAAERFARSVAPALSRYQRAPMRRGPTAFPAGYPARYGGGGSDK
jgi:hypothetical protein